MATMNISLPQALKDWVEDQADAGLYANSSDYVRDLIRRDVEKREKLEALRLKIEEAERSGFREMTVEEIQAELLARRSK